MKKKTLLVTVLVLVILIAGATVLYNTLGDNVDPGAGVGQTSEYTGEAEVSDESDSTEEKVLAPDFTVYDNAGGAVRLSDFRGMPVVLNFWASWCGPCKSEMPDFDEAAEKYSGEVVFLMVNLTDGSQETVDTAYAFINEQGYTFPVFYDTEMEAAQTYGVTSVPMTYFIDAEGYGIARAMGAIDGDMLQQGIDMIY